jgi:hypothetical protein
MIFVYGIGKDYSTLYSGAQNLLLETTFNMIRVNFYLVQS